MKKVTSVLLLLSCFFLFSYVLHLPPKVSLRVEQQNCFEGKPISLVISIDHMQSDLIDPSSFTIAGEKLQVQEIGMKAVGDSPSPAPNTDNFVVSRYSALLTPRIAGIYVVGPVDVPISGNSFRSNSITINVLEAIVTKKFTIASSIQAPRSMYPGQKIQVEYRLLFQNNMQILHEELPLLDLAGFLPLGSPKVIDLPVGDDIFQETITREFRAVHPGEFTFGPSSIEGMSYVDRGGNRELIPPLMTSKEGGKTIVVTPFPKDGKPIFFEGALGSFVWRGRILGSNQVKLDSHLEVEWRVTGRGDIDTIRFPTLSESTVFNSRFLIEGPLREVRVDESTRTFSLTLRPKMAGIRQIPGFQFASFDPVVKEYISVVCPPLAVGVEELKSGDESHERPVTTLSHLILPYDPNLAELVRGDIPLSLELVWVICFLCIIVGAVEKYYFGNQRKKTYVRRSQNIYYKAYSKRRQPKVSAQLLKEALLLRLLEVGLIEDDTIATAGLSSKGVVGEVKRVVQSIDENLFGKGSGISFDEIWKDSSLVYHTLKSLPEVKKNET